MSFFLYIIQNTNGAFYKGVSTHPPLRLLQHNNNEVRSTANKGPLHFVAVFEFSSKTQALIRERKIKKYGRDKILELLERSDNVIQRFIP